MNLSSFAVRRPVTILMVILGVILFGSISLRRLGIELFPELNFPVVAIATVQVGADPSSIENNITKPIETAISTISGLKRVEAYSSENLSVVLAQFDWHTDVSAAMGELRAALEQASYLLPSDAKKPVVVEMDPTQLPVMVIGVTGEQPHNLAELIETTVCPHLERIEGVAQVSLLGARQRQIQVLYDPKLMAANNVSIDILEQVIKYQNMFVPAGAIENDGKRYSLVAGHDLERPEQIADLVVGLKQVGSFLAQPVRVGDIADVKLTLTARQGYARVNDKEALLLQVFKKPGENTVAVADAVKAALRELHAQNLAPVEFFTLSDQSVFIKQAVANLAQNALVGALLAVLVLLLFLRNYQTILIIGFAIPLSIMATFVALHFLGLTMNLMTLGGLALGVGMLVDNSIVVLENIFRHLQEGKTPVQAARLGSSQIASAITSSTLTTLVVFLPVVYVGGVAGEIFKELGLTVCLSLIASLGVALTVVPMLASRFLRPPSNQVHPVPDAEEALRPSRAFTMMQDIYTRCLGWALRNKPVVLLVLFAVCGLAAYTASHLEIEFLPSIDQGIIDIQVEAPIGTTLGQTNDLVREVEQILLSLPDVDEVSAQVGNPGTSDLLSQLGNAPNRGRLTVVLADRHKRSMTTEQLVEEIRRRTAHLQQARILIGDETSQSGWSSLFSLSATVELRGADRKLLVEKAQQLDSWLRESPYFSGVKSSQDNRLPQLVLAVDANRALAQGGLTAAQIGLALRRMVSGNVVSHVDIQGQSTPVVVRQKLQEPPLQSLLGTRIDSPFVENRGALLGKIVHPEEQVVPSTLRRIDGLPSVTLTASLDGIGVLQAERELERLFQKLQLPAGFDARLGGLHELIAESTADLGFALLLAVVLVYMVMAAQFESLVHPLAIMFSIPLAVGGALLLLAGAGLALSVPAFIGLIVLTGIIVNNAIVLVDYINMQRRNGMPVQDAILSAARVRLRPILMTTVTTVLGLIPLALGIGEGAELQVPLAVAIIGGMVVGTFLTLFVVPVMYRILENLSTSTPRLIPRRSKHQLGH